MFGLRGIGREKSCNGDSIQNPFDERYTGPAEKELEAFKGMKARNEASGKELEERMKKLERQVAQEKEAKEKLGEAQKNFIEARDGLAKARNEVKKLGNPQILSGIGTGVFGIGRVGTEDPKMGNPLKAVPGPMAMGPRQNIGFGENRYGK